MVNNPNMMVMMVNNPNMIQLVILFVESEYLFSGGELPYDIAMSTITGTCVINKCHVLCVITCIKDRSNGCKEQQTFCHV